MLGTYQGTKSKVRTYTGTRDVQEVVNQPCQPCAIKMLTSNLDQLKHNGVKLLVQGIILNTLVHGASAKQQT